MAPPKLTSEEIKLRGTLLSSSRELLQLHRTLVRGNLITEEEFWESRLPLLKSQEALLKQQKPIPSTFGRDDALKTGLDGDQQQKIIFTPETIEAILKQNPTLLRAYKDFVPTKMSEKEFWTFYVQSRFFQKTAPSYEAPTILNPLNEYWKDAERDKEEQNDNFDIDYMAVNTQVSRGVDMTSTADDHFSDYGNRTAQHLKSQEGDKSISLIKKFNNHSLKIVQKSVGRSLPPMRIEDSIDLEDLAAPSEKLSQPLNVSSTGGPSRGTKECRTEQNISVEQRNEFFQDLLKLEGDTLGFIRKNMKASQERREILSKFTFKCKLREAPTSDRKLPLALMNLSGSDIMLFHNNAAEVLRHFWMAYPSGKNADRQAKLFRMRTIIEQLLKKGKELIATRSNIRDQVAIEAALGPIMQSLEYAHSQDQALTKASEPYPKKTEWA